MRNVEAQGAKSRKGAFLRHEQRQRNAPKKTEGRAGRGVGAGYLCRSKRGLITKVGAASQALAKCQLPLGP